MFVIRKMPVDLAINWGGKKRFGREESRKGEARGRIPGGEKKQIRENEKWEGSRLSLISEKQLQSRSSWQTGLIVIRKDW